MRWVRRCRGWSRNAPAEWRTSRDRCTRTALSADVTVEQATDALWMLCSFDSFDAVYSDRGKTVDESIHMLVQTAERAVCRADDALVHTGAADPPP